MSTLETQGETGRGAPTRRRRRGPALTAILLAAIGVFLVVPPGEGCACATPRDVRGRLRNALGTFMLAQETYFADSIRYATDTAALALEPITGIRLTLEAATALGYRASAAVSDLALEEELHPGTCLTWVGDSTLAVPGVPEGEPRCFVPPPPRWRFGAYGPPELEPQ